MEHINKFLVDFHNFQQTFTGEELHTFMVTYADIPIFAAGAYLTLVFGGQKYMEKRPAYNLRSLFALWNLFLAVFSIVGGYYTIPKLWGLITTIGLRDSMCRDPRGTYYHGPGGFWLAAFILSKIPEFLDTSFLIFQKKPVIFLHWFHHATVMLFCWHAHVVLAGPGIWFAVMNYAVHSVMYSYYFLTATPLRKMVTPLNKFITSAQIAQMVAGMAVIVATWILSHTEQGCFTNGANTRLGLAMYTSYFILFAQLFYANYLDPKGKHARGNKSADAAAAAQKKVQ